MDWDDVRVFLAVVRGQGLTSAARSLKTSPQTVGRRISAFEVALGGPLFLRSPTGYQLTEDGRALLGDAERIEEDMARLRARASGRTAALAGTVRLAAPENFVTHLLLPGLAGFLDRHPALRLEILTGVEPVSMARGDADLALRLVRPESGELTIRRVGAMAHALYAAPAYLATNPGAEGRPLDTARLIGWAESCARLPSARWLASHTHREPDLAFSNLAAQHAAVAAGLGVAVLPCFLAHGLIRVGEPTSLAEPIWLVAHDAGIASERVRIVYDEVMRLMVEAAPMLAGQP
jgi:DNA-binding transcriptional LysR family regulator